MSRPKRSRNQRNGASNSMLRDTTRQHLSYSDTVSIDPGAASITSHVFRCNNIFDPDLTSTGHQPLTYDEYSLLYSTYRVLSAKIKVTPLWTTSSSVVPGFWGVFRDEVSALTYSSSTQVIEDPRTGKFGVSAGVFTNYSDRYGGALTATFVADRDLPPKGADNAVPIDSGPTDSASFSRYFSIWAGSILGNNPGAVDLLIEIDYEVEFAGRKVITPS